MKQIIVFFFICISCTVTSARDCDSAEVRRLCALSQKELSQDISKAMSLARQAYRIAEECPKTNSYYESVIALASVFYQNDQSDSIIALILPQLKSIPPGVSGYNKARLHHKLSSAYVMLLQFENGLRHGLEALKNYEQAKDSSNIASILANIANIYQQQNNFPLALKYLKDAEAIAGKLKKKTALGNVYSTIGVLYAQHDKMDSALYFFLKATAIREQLNDLTTLPWDYNNLGGVYVMMGQPAKGAEFLEKALAKFEESQNYDGQTSASNNLGELYLSLKQNDKALYYFSYSRKLYKKTNNPDNLVSLYKNLSEYYKLTNDPKLALKYTDSLIALKDSLYGKQLAQNIAEMQTKFDVEKKDLQISKHEAELKTKEEQLFIKNIILVAVFILVVLSGLLIYSLQKRKQIREEAKQAAEMAKQKELRSKAVIEAEEKERVRIAQDLHDGVGQLLSAAKLNLSGLEAELDLKDESRQSLFKNALDLVNDSVKEVRAVSHNMMPNTLIKLGLVSAVREFITKLSSVPNLKIDLEIVGLDERLDQQTESVLYRVIQEAINNIIKHAGASRISLQLIRHEKELTVMIEDNGKGFDASRIKESEGLGLKGIISRIEFLNGSVDFDSTPGKGTTVTIEIAC